MRYTFTRPPSWWELGLWFLSFAVVFTCLLIGSGWVHYLIGVSAFVLGTSLQREFGRRERRTR